MMQTRSPLTSHLPARVPPGWLLLAGLATAPLAGATTFNTTDVEHHGQWQSLTLTLGDERHFRALEVNSYSDATLSLNFTPGVCDLPWLEVRVDLDERQPESRAVNLVPADLRVDHETIHSGMAEFITQRGDSGFYVHFYLDEQPLLIDEMRAGEILRLRFTLGNGEILDGGGPPDGDNHWFMAFTLHGAGAAIERAERRCQDTGP
jgi:hypothetical protein